MANSDDNGDTDHVNKQIVDAVKVSTDYAFGVPGGTGGAPKYNAGEAIAYEKVAQPVPPGTPKA